MAVHTAERIQEMLHAFQEFRKTSRGWFKTIVLTGGPCGGKSQFLKKARPRLEKKYNCKVIAVPEVARELMQAGFPPTEKWKHSTAFQIRTALAILEKEFFYLETLKLLELTNTDKNVIFICDRGLMDSAAYIGIPEFDKVLMDLGISPEDALNRYDMIIHLISAAVGAEPFYKADKERKETLAQAKKVDPKTILAWKRHPHHVVVDNSTTFSKKINRAIREIGMKLDLQLKAA